MVLVINDSRLLSLLNITNIIDENSIVSIMLFC